MKSFTYIVAISAAGVAMLTSCEKSPPPKFHAGDRVRVKMTHEEGRVCLWTRLFREDHYFVTLPGGIDVFQPVREREYWAAQAADFIAKYGFYWTDPPRKFHEEGPFYESELELVR